MTDATQDRAAKTRMVYKVKDADGNVVREGESLVSPEGVVSYGQLSDLPVGDYTIVPGPIKLEVIDGPSHA